MNVTSMCINVSECEDVLVSLLKVEELSEDIEISRQISRNLALLESIGTVPSVTKSRLNELCNDISKSINELKKFKDVISPLSPEDLEKVLKLLKDLGNYLERVLSIIRRITYIYITPFIVIKVSLIAYLTISLLPNITMYTYFIPLMVSVALVSVILLYTSLRFNQLWLIHSVVLCEAILIYLTYLITGLELIVTTLCAMSIIYALVTLLKSYVTKGI